MLLFCLTSFSFAQSRTKSNSVYVAVNEKNSSYTYNASFHIDKTLAVKKIIEKYLGRASGETNNWRWTPNEVLEASLKAGKVRVELDKESKSSVSMEKLKEMADEIGEIINEKGPKRPIPPTPPNS